jgi:hypothetical protein
MQKRKREEILAAVDASEPFMEKHLGPDYVHYLEHLPEIAIFLEELKVK